MRRLATMCLLGWAFSGCAFTDVPLDLPTGGFQTLVLDGRGRHVLVAVPFTDAREIRDRCGMQKNGYNVDTANAICQSAPNVWIAQLLVEQLRSAGFVVLEEGHDDQADALRIEGSLIKIFVEPVLGMWSISLEADLSVKLHATTATGLEAERTFFVKGWKAGQQISSVEAYNIALRRATQVILTEMVSAIVELMDRYPGKHSSPAVAFSIPENER